VENNKHEGSADYTHLIRLAITVVVVLLLMYVVRKALTPKTFGEFGHYRAAAVMDNMQFEPKHIGTEICAGCHHKQAEAKQDGVHQGVKCETCHGPGWKHADDPENVKLRKPTERLFCGYCHSRNIARPKGFPQVELNKHYPDGLCVDCHNPHSPKL
jgi:hypothetical protein